MSDQRIIDLTRARKFAESGELDQAWQIAQHYLSENPHDIEALVVATFATRKARNLPVAYHFARHVTEVAPREAAGWINFGQICNELWLEDEAEKAYKRGLEIAQRDSDKAMLLHNWSALMIDQGRFDEGMKLAERSLAYHPESRGARANLGFCQLAKRQWAEGWKNYRACLGMETRRKVQYRDEPEWDGSPDKTVVLYGEQGIGDEICFASMVPDAIARSRKVILDVDARLEGLFRRSFPQARVYGTRQATADSGVKWDVADRDFDCSLAIAQIGQFFRLRDEDFPGTPYLVADDDRVTMWRALWAKKGKPVIGVAWSSGIRETGRKYRMLTLEQLLPLFQSVDAHWVSLEYKDRRAEIAAFREKHPEVDLVQYSHAVLTQDYDDTAALIASLDLCIGIHTSSMHCAGALGVPAWVFVPTISQWRYGTGHTDMVWYRSIRLIRQKRKGEWGDVIENTSEELRAHFGQLSRAAA